MAKLEDIADLPGFGPSKIDSFRNAGYDTLEDLRGITWDELGEVKGIKSSAKRRALLNFLEEQNLREKPETEEKYEKFRALLEELFQFESADLDFGVYRIMNEKRGRIEEFLDEELQEKVKNELEEFQATEQSEARERLEAAKEQINNDFPHWADEHGNIDEEALPDDAQGIAKERKDEYLEAKAEAEKADIGESTEAAIYQDLYRFFKRYYEDGDFIPQRRAANQEKYAIPYNGEEVKLHWANKDQYFVKTGEQFQDYKFRKDSYDIEFKLHDAHVEKSNKKGDEKYFVLRERNPIEQEDRCLTVHFEYRPLREEDYDEYGLSESSRTKSGDIQDDIKERILSEVSSQLREVLESDTETEYSNSSVLEKHLKNYRTKNEEDYFIHKDLGGFLEQELDFYLKNEVFSWKELTDETGEIPSHVRARLNAVENIATEIIEFISQIEDFQKKLYEKKKFVVNSEYCVTLDKVPEELYSEILENDEQLEKWRELYAIDEKSGLAKYTGSAEFDEDYLEQHQSMMIDTKFFDPEFKFRLLSHIDDVDSATEGVLVNGENYQSLKLLENKYSDSIDCIYIDPPYNTGNDGFVYKDNYPHSSWLSMLNDRASASRQLLNEDGAFFSSIDDNEMDRYNLLLSDIFGEENNAANLIARLNPRGRTMDKYVAHTHEYILSYVKDSSNTDAITGMPKEGEMLEEYDREDDRGKYRDIGLRNRNPQFNRENRPNLYFPLYINPDTNEVALEENEDYSIEIHPTDSRGRDDCWTWSEEKVANNIDMLVGRKTRNGDWRVYRKDYLRDENGEVAKTMAKSVWTDKEINNQRGKEALKHLMGDHTVDFPKSVDLIKKCVKIGAGHDGTVLDFFAGSGTTAQAVLELNEEYDQNRDYVMIEMADYLHEVIKPRIIKWVYSEDWELGVPEGSSGRSHLFKYIETEDFEDTLHQENLKSGDSQASFDEFSPSRLSYYLNFEVDGPSLLDLGGLKDPFEYSLYIQKGNETKKETIDLIETFNYLLGLEVRSIQQLENNDRKYRVVNGERDNENVTVIWRTVEDDDGEEFFENDREFLRSNVLGDEDSVYINYDSALPDAKSIEKIFQNRMWE
ncbi:DNA methyltransferase [Natrialbaceae archaeon GCM10025810]|uniref:site-specific DNA-methyltransferase n=1 Tax=Halovalidus salilacus TaxID=3075124 RepID=UPI0036098CE0